MRGIFLKHLSPELEIKLNKDFIPTEFIGEISSFLKTIINFIDDKFFTKEGIKHILTLLDKEIETYGSR